MKITKTRLKQIIKEELEALASSGGVNPGGPWVMPKGYEKDPYQSSIEEVYAFLDKSYEEKQGNPTKMAYALEYFPPIVKEDLGPNWVRWMVANYFNDKLERERTPKEVSKTYTQYFTRM